MSALQPSSSSVSFVAVLVDVFVDAKGYPRVALAAAAGEPSREFDLTDAAAAGCAGLRVGAKVRATVAGCRLRTVDTTERGAIAMVFVTIGELAPLAERVAGERHSLLGAAAPARSTAAPSPAPRKGARKLPHQESAPE